VALHHRQLLWDDIAGCNPIGDRLLLDKPDNHLDHASRQLLIQVLADYLGTLLLVSHDPDFVAGVGIEREYWLSENSAGIN